MSAMRGKIVFAMAALCLLALTISSSSVAEAADGCEFKTLFKDGKSAREHLVAGGFDGYGLHPNPSDNTQAGNVFGVDTKGEVYAPFAGVVKYAGPDTVGTGGNIIAIDGGGNCVGWRILISHDDEIRVSVGQEVTTDTFLAKEGRAGVASVYAAHNHISIGYVGDLTDISGVTQYDRYGQHWVNPVLIEGKTVSPGHAVLKSQEVLGTVEKETTVLNTTQGDIAKNFVFLVTALAVTTLLVFAIWLKLTRKRYTVTYKPKPSFVKRLGFIVTSLATFCNLMFVISVVGPPPWELRVPPQFSSVTNNVSVGIEDNSWLVWADKYGVGLRNLEANIVASSTCWSVSHSGNVAVEGEACRKVDLLVLLAIDHTESSDADFAWYDPTKPGPMGWRAVETSAYERWGNVGGLRQLKVIWRILMQPEMRKRYPNAIADVDSNGTYEPERGDRILVYGSSATCIGRSQGLPTSIELFSNELVADPNFTFDPWNDELSSALFKSAHLAASYVGDTVWERRYNAVAAYNSGAADLEWMLTLDRLKELVADLPSTQPTLTLVVTTEVSSDNNSESGRFYVPYALAIEKTPLESLLLWSRSRRLEIANKWGINVSEIQRDAGNDREIALAVWGEWERLGCKMSWAFAARPCKEETAKFSK